MDIQDVALVTFDHVECTKLSLNTFTQSNIHRKDVL